MISSMTPSNLFSQNLTDQSARFSAAQLNYTQVSAYSRQTQDITIYTREGDRVTISSALESQFSYSSLEMLSYEAQRNISQNEVAVRQRAGYVRGEAFEFENTQSYQVAVEGDLSEEELADVQKAIRLIKQTMFRFMARENPAGSMIPGALENLDSLAGVQSRFELEQSMTVEKVSLSAQAYEKDDIPGLDEQQDPMARIRGLIEELAEIIKASGAKFEKIIQTLDDFFSQLRKDISAKDDSNPSQNQVVDWIRNGLMKRLGNTASA